MAAAIALQSSEEIPPLQAGGGSGGGGVDDLPNTVILNLYDITELNGFLAPMGIGAHHAGVQVYGLEFGFGGCPQGTGVMRNPPGFCPPHIPRERLVLGVTALSAAETSDVIRQLSQDPLWLGCTYHLLSHNCLHFAEVLVARLRPSIPSEPHLQPLFFVSQSADGSVIIPAYVSRLQRLGAKYLPEFIKAKFDAFSVPSTGGIDSSAPIILNTK